MRAQRGQLGYPAGNLEPPKIVSETSMPKWWIGLASGAPKTCKDLAGIIRFRAGLGPKTEPNQTQNIRNGTHRRAHNDSERFLPNFGVFRRRPETFKLCDSSAESVSLLESRARVKNKTTVRASRIADQKRNHSR